MQRNRKKYLLVFTALMLIMTIIECLIFIPTAFEKRSSRQNDAMSYGKSLASSIQLTLENSVDSSETLKYIYAVYGESCFSHFDEIAGQIYAENPVIGSMYIAPKAVIRLAYPSEVNASTIGFAMLEDPEQGPRAQLAIDTRKVTIAGPHRLIEGGMGLIIRNPLFADDEFVGFTIVVLDWDRFVEQVLANTASANSYYKFAVWTDDHDTTAVTDSDGYILRNTSDAVSKLVDIEFTVPNNTWHLVVEPESGWLVISELTGPITAGVVAGLLLVVLCMFLFDAEMSRLAMMSEIRAGREKEKYTAQLSEALTAAENASKAKTTFLNNMTHDIRTPMNAILGYTELMSRELDEPDRLRDHLEKVRVSGEYLLTLINNILEVSRIDSGKEQVDESFIDLLDESCSVTPLLENELSRKQLKFTREMHIEHRYVFADIQKIREITINLMSNAIKYTPAGGSIHQSFTELDCLRRGYARYASTIEDTGIGMSEEFVEHIFESFTRERNSTESRVEGTGLGMSIVKKLTDLMGGTVQVESTLGKGSRFTVIFEHRIVDDPEKYIRQQHETIAESHADFHGRRILLAEDNDLNAEIATSILEELGAAVERAEDGVICVNMVSDRADSYYDLILMDIQMPNLDGFGAAKRIRSLGDSRKAAIPIIALTANAFAEDRQAALNAGMNGHLAKPIEIPKLIEMLSEILK